MKHSIRFLSIFITSLVFAGDFYTESTIPDDAGADYVIIKDNKIVDMINKGLEYRVDAPVANEVPIVNAGSNKNICEGQSVRLTASASDSDGSVSSYKWSENGVTLSNSSSFVYTPSSPGYHDVVLTVRDDEGVASSDTTKVYASTYPTVNAGIDKTITLNDTINLSGSSNDTDGSIASLRWYKSSGLITETLGINNDISYKPTESGTYNIYFSATDNIGCVKRDSMALTVNEPTPPEGPGTFNIDGKVYWWCDSCSYAPLWNNILEIVKKQGGTFVKLQNVPAPWSGKNITSVIHDAKKTFYVQAAFTHNKGGSNQVMQGEMLTINPGDRIYFHEPRGFDKTGKATAYADKPFVWIFTNKTFVP